MYVDVLKRQLDKAVVDAAKGDFMKVLMGLCSTGLYFHKNILPYLKDEEDPLTLQKVKSSIYRRIADAREELNMAMKVSVSYKTVCDFLHRKGSDVYKKARETVEIKMPCDCVYLEFVADPPDRHIFGLIIKKFMGDVVEVKIFNYVADSLAWRVLEPLLVLKVDLKAKTKNINTTIDTPGTSYMLECLRLSHEAGGDEDFLFASNLFRAMTSYVVNSLLALSTREVTIRSITEKKTVPRVGKAKKGKRKVASITYNVIDFPLEEEVHLLTNAGGGTKHVTHASPRQHTRVGHWRKCRTKSVWIEPTVVGKAENGTVDKEYKVVRKAITIKRVNNETNNPELPRP